MNENLSKLPNETISLIKAMPFETNSYKFLDLIGTGSYAACLKCYNPKNDRYFAAKIIMLRNQDDIPSIDVCNSELNALMRLNHPNIIKLYDSFEYKEHLFIILQLAEKGTLGSLIKSTRGLEFQNVILIMRQLLSSLAYCHNQKIAHRDIKPANVFLDSYNRPLLADFGFAVNCTEKTINKFCGSFQYRAPEILQQQAHCPFKADIWAMGVTFFEISTGISPWPTHVHELTQKSIVAGKYHIPDRVPRPIADVIKKMMVLDPKSRCTADQLLELPVFQKEQTIIMKTFSPSPTPSQQTSKQPMAFEKAASVAPQMPTKLKCCVFNTSQLDHRVIIPGKLISKAYSKINYRPFLNSSSLRTFV